MYNIPGEWIIDIQPTCEENGGQHKACTTCNGMVEIAEIDALGHTEVIDNAQNATCTSEGLTEGKHCSVCQKVLVAQEKLAKTEHSYSDGICTVCGTEAPNNTEETSSVADEPDDSTEKSGCGSGGCGAGALYSPFLACALATITCFVMDKKRK